MDYEDTTVVCDDCNEDFTFTGEEQAFFAEKGFQTPKRCKPCRDARKGSRMGGSGPREMHDVICSDCGDSTQVPFKPSGDRPVYCSDCFKNHR